MQQILKNSGAYHYMLLALDSSSTFTLSNFIHYKEFDWNGDVATRVDMRTTKVKFFKKYLSEGMGDPDKIIRPGR